MTKKAAVIGYPISQSLSPTIHGHWLKTYGIDGEYSAREVAPGTLAETIVKFREEGLVGVNVTVPLKEEAFALAQSDDVAQEAGAANLLLFQPHGIAGRNTDVHGLEASILENAARETFRGKPVTLLGTGGAARGALVALARLGASEIRIVYRTRANAERLVKNYSRKPPVMLLGWEEAVAGTSLIVNTTSAGMKGNPPLDLSFAAVPKTAMVLDIVYNPLMTDFLKRAAANGNPTIDGLGMLLHQAAPSFEAFFGVKPEVTKELRALLESKLHG